MDNGEAWRDKRDQEAGREAVDAAVTFCVGS